MYLDLGFVVLTVLLFFDLGLTLPTEGQQGSEDITPFELGHHGVPVKRQPIKSASDQSPASSDVIEMSLSCNPNSMSYFYQWTPMIDDLCKVTGESLGRNYTGTYTNPDPLAGEAKQATIKWNATGDSCALTCRQVFNQLWQSPDCHEEDFWVSDNMKVDYEGCGFGSVSLEYPSRATLSSGTGVCWGPAAPPSYEPDLEANERFCGDAVEHIRSKGREFRSNDAPRTGFYGTSYDRRVGRREDQSARYDTGMVHFWIVATGAQDACGPGQSLDDQLGKLTVDRCVQLLGILERQPCGAPSKKSFGGRIWADCLEFGIKASGYDGWKAPF